MKPLYFLLLFLVMAACQKNMVPQEIGTEVNTWSITEGEFTPNRQSTDKLGSLYWNKITGVLPQALLNKYITSMRLYTDGPSEDLGGMSPLDDSNTQWEIDLDTADINLHNLDSVFVLEYNHTLIHEFGHLLTLNIEQVEPTEDQVQDDNKGYLTSEGYARKDSYLGKFVDTFWPEDFLLAWDKIDRIRNEKRRVNGYYDFYLKHQPQFTTDYSAESPEEDIAESWTFFVLTDKPASSEIRAQKVLFFYQFSELIALREHIRSNIDFIPKGYLENYGIEDSVQ